MCQGCVSYSLDLLLSPLLSGPTHCWPALRPLMYELEQIPQVCCILSPEPDEACQALCFLPRGGRCKGHCCPTHTQMSVLGMSDPWALYSVPLIYQSISDPTSHSSNYCGFVAALFFKLKTKQKQFAHFSHPLQHIICLSLSN